MRKVPALDDQMTDGGLRDIRELTFHSDLILAQFNDSLIRFHVCNFLIAYIPWMNVSGVACQ
ncbi:hypothetical protein M378DRAFT_368172 [Amanita muscaria Koide BX008]|uniref:Uncharacterized protein n=1 Tax=Amanita muscaria (strain Koide BX008) TaxID=946122 RepID=A0A0C2ST76_AMAMK|nr:hypothetical protein M378DRAFT_368172 [Amanita muscaria Koide BX008]